MVYSMSESWQKLYSNRAWYRSEDFVDLEIISDLIFLGP